MAHFSHSTVGQDMHYITVFGLLSLHSESQRCRTTVTNTKTIQSMPSLWDTALPLTALWWPCRLYRWQPQDHYALESDACHSSRLANGAESIYVRGRVRESERDQGVRRTWEPTHLSRGQHHFLSPSLATSIATLVSWPHQGHHLPLVLAQSLANGRHWQEATQKEEKEISWNW